MSKIKGIITNIRRGSTEDGPGIRTTVFLKGCPMRCEWCHNVENLDSQPELVWYHSKCIADQACVDTCPEHALELSQEGMIINRNTCNVCSICEEVCPTGALMIMGKEWIVDDLVKELVRDKVFFETSDGGVTLSGGEPTHQIGFMNELADALRKSGVQVVLDTCGYSSESVFQNALKHVDVVLFDLKHMNPEKHEKFTGVPLETVLSNAEMLSRSGLRVWVRTPIIPGYTDDEGNIREISKFILEKIPNIERYELLAFNKMAVGKYTQFGLEYPLKDADLVSRETMEHLVTIARDVGVRHVEWSGMTKRNDSETSKSSTNIEASNCE